MRLKRLIKPPAQPVVLDFGIGKPCKNLQGLNILCGKILILAEYRREGYSYNIQTQREGDKYA